MKLKQSILLVLMLLSIGIFAQELSSTEKAIKKAIEDETHLYNQRDYDGWAATWVQSPNIYWSVAGPESSMEVHGWEELSSSTKEYFEKNPEPIETTENKAGYAFMVNGNMAFVTFKENGNMSTRVLAKKSGTWQLMRMGVVQSVAYARHKQMKSMQDLVGVWYMDPTTVNLSDDNWILNELKCKVKKTDVGIKMYVSSDWKNNEDGFTGTWKDEYMMSRDSEAGAVGVMVSMSGPYGTSVHTGKCHFKDDYMVIKTNKMGAEKALMKHKIIPKSDDVVKMHYIFYNEEGEKEWEMSFDLTKNKDESMAMN